MEFVQFWREKGKMFQPYERETLESLYKAAFMGGAIAATKLTVMGFDLVKEKYDVEEDKK